MGDGEPQAHALGELGVGSKVAAEDLFPDLVRDPNPVVGDFERDVAAPVLAPHELGPGTDPAFGALAVAVLDRIADQIDERELGDCFVDQRVEVAHFVDDLDALLLGLQAQLLEHVVDHARDPAAARGMAALGQGQDANVVEQLFGAGQGALHGVQAPLQRRVFFGVEPAPDRLQAQLHRGQRGA